MDSLKTTPVRWDDWYQSWSGPGLPLWQCFVLIEGLNPEDVAPPGKSRGHSYLLSFDAIYPPGDTVRRQAERHFGDELIAFDVFMTWMDRWLDGVSIPWPLAIYRSLPDAERLLELERLSHEAPRIPSADLGAQETHSAESEQLSWEVAGNQQNYSKGGRHEGSIRDCHLVSAAEASEILEKIFPDTTRKYWVRIIQKESKWLYKDFNNQFGGMSWLVKANGGAGGSGYGPTRVYLPIMLVRFIQHSKTADEAQSKLDLIQRSNLEPLSAKLAFDTIERCAMWTIKNRLSRSI